MTQSSLRMKSWDGDVGAWWSIVTESHDVVLDNKFITSNNITTTVDIP